MTPISRRTVLASSAASVLVAMAPKRILAEPATRRLDPANTEWTCNGGDLAYTRYAPLSQINAENFDKLEIAWRFRTASLGPTVESNLQATPLLIKGRLYLTAGSRRTVICLDARTGELIWLYRLDEGKRARNAPRQLSGRGVGYWTDGTEERILFVTIGYQLVSLDVRTGRPDPQFGVGGIVDLKQGLDQQLDPETADIGLHSAPTIARNVIIVGAAHASSYAPRTRKNVRGYVRGFDVRTGRRKWIFHTIPHKGEFGYDTWAAGSADQTGNTGAWAQISADEELGLAYVGVEMPTGDQVGVYRPGDNLFSESLVALDIETGERRWHYQFVHHGLWDYDVPCAAILCDLPMGRRIVKAIAQPTKQGFTFVLDRATGKPLFPVRERPVPMGNVPGESYSPTQPIPTRPPPFDRQGSSPEVLIDFTPELKEKALKIASRYTFGPLYTPPLLAVAGGSWGVLNLPGYTGGANWPGAAYDPETSRMFIYSQTNFLIPGTIVANSNQSVSEFEYIRGTAQRTPGTANAALPGPGVLRVDGLPLVKPPWGRVTALDLALGTMVWQTAHGETPDEVRNHPALKGLEIPRTGQAGYGAGFVTRTLFIISDTGSFTDRNGRKGARLRAYDKDTGEERGAVYLPAHATGVPMTFMLDGVQHIAVAVAGTVANEGAELIVLRLPEDVLQP